MFTMRLDLSLCGMWYCEALVLLVGGFFYNAEFLLYRGKGQYRPKHVVVSITVIKYTSVIKLCLTTYLFLVLVSLPLQIGPIGCPETVA